jgi:hypothetical protein
LSRRERLRQIGVSRQWSKPDQRRRHRDG